MMDRLEAHAARLFLTAADERCIALKAFHDAFTSKGRGAAEAKDRAARRLGHANGLYEVARSELIDAADRADAARTAQPST